MSLTVPKISLRELSKPVERTEVKKLLNGARRVLLWGPPGTGKTFSCCKAAKGDFFKLILTTETPSAELRGHWIPEGNAFRWHDGPAIAAWRQGIPLILDEIGEASADTLSFLLGLLDDLSVARLTLPTGETVVPAKSFRCWTTTNSVPDQLSPALLDRFDVVMAFTEPVRAAFNCWPKTIGDVLFAMSKPPKGKIDYKVAGFDAVSARRSQAFFDLQKSVGWTLAAKSVFGEQAPDVLNAIRSGLKHGRAK